MTFLSYDGRRFFLTGMRLFFGVWLLYVALVKWIQIGPVQFVGFITTDFDKTWSPHGLNVMLAWVILFAEPIIAVGILSGWKARVVWSVAALFMFMLVLGQTILMKPDVTGNWEYLVVLLACAAMSEPRQAVKA